MNEPLTELVEMTACFRRTLFLKFLALLVVFLLAEVPSGTTGTAYAQSGSTSHREVVDAFEYPWSAIGRVNISGVASRSHCTGALIGERLVLTAAHCLYYRTTQRYVAPELIHFLAGYQRGEFIAHSTAFQIVPSPDFDGVKWADPANLPHDWALIILNDPIGKKAGFLGYQPLDSGLLDTLTRRSEFFFLAGYPRDREHAISLDTTCNIVGFLNAGALISHSCQILGGDSGAPISIQSSDGLQVIGLNSATGVGLGDGTQTNTAVPISTITQLVERAIRHTEKDPVFMADTGRRGQRPQ